MESISTTKRRRITQNISIPTIQCKREFNLPHKFPSKIVEKKNVVQKVPNVTNAVNNSVTLKNFNTLKSENFSSPSKVTKLRIRSQDGKDLGEVKVKFLSQENVLNTKTITFSKASLNHTISKPIKLSIMSSNNSGTIMNYKSLRNDVKMSKVAAKLISSNNLKADSDKQSDTKEKNNNKVQLQYALPTVNKIKQLNNDKLILLKNNSHKYSEKVQDLSKSIPKYVTIKKNKILFVNNQQKHDSNSKKDINHTDENKSKMNTSNIQQDLYSVKHRKLTESKFPVVRCKKFSIFKNKRNPGETFISCVNTNNTESITNADPKNCIVEKNINSFKNSSSMKPVNNTEHNTNISINPLNSTDKVIHVTFQNGEKNSSVILDKRSILKKQDDKITLVPASNKQLNSESQNVFNDMHKSNSDQNKTISNNNNSIRVKDSICNVHQNETLPNDDSTKSENSTSEKSNDKSKANETGSAEIPKQDKLLQHWNIIQEAVISVKDEELRTKALQALADCGIGMPKQVPISPPEKLKTVHDSPIQTDVFGLLDLENFVLVKEDTPVLKRIKQTEQSTVHPPTINAATQVHSVVNVNRNIDDINLFPSLTPVCSQDVLELDNYFNEYFSENTDVDRVKKVLSTHHSLYNKVSTQLKIDHEGMQQFDESGMLNIHRAVVNNQLQEVQRLLLVLQASKIDIDVLTEDGETCLELAVKYNSSEDIVTVLLEAGAKPITSELLHESAILLASKCSSPLLPVFLKYVTYPELLNQMDSLGFAALHYCALSGNLEGVSALIEAGANVNLKDSRSGRTPFFHALENNHVQVAQKLLVNGAVANLPNFSGQTVLALIDETKSLSIKAALKHVMTT
ncbi:uncharacterized protein LOC100878432 [Megachile rotundata]|uniref:uncharacterized protein LOC100878432 n=1 Tax=Megachile rotundata TaxID=143995 RepID=UPI003FD12548